MATQLRVSGQAQLREMEVRLAAMGKDFDARVAKNLRRVPPKIAKAIQASAMESLPHRGGYAPLLAKSIKYKASVTIKHGMVMQIWATGKAERRDLPVINLGRLRHPVFGNREVWRTTRVKPGFVDRGVKAAQPLIVKAVKDARDDTVHDVVR